MGNNQQGRYERSGLTIIEVWENWTQEKWGHIIEGFDCKAKGFEDVCQGNGTPDILNGIFLGAGNNKLKFLCRKSIRKIKQKYNKA